MVKVNTKWPEMPWALSLTPKCWSHTLHFLPFLTPSLHLSRSTGTVKAKISLKKKKMPHHCHDLTVYFAWNFSKETHTHLLGAASIDINFLEEKTTPECCWYWQQCFPSHTVSCTQAFISTCSHHITAAIYCCSVLLHVVESELVMCSSFHVLACSFEYWEIWKRRQSPENRRWKFTLINIYLQARLKQKATNPAHWVSEHSSFEHPPVGVIISRRALFSNFLQILIFLLTLLTQKVGHMEACRRSPVCTTAIAGYQSELPACKDFRSLSSIFYTVSTKWQGKTDEQTGWQRKQKRIFPHEGFSDSTHCEKQMKGNVWQAAGDEFSLLSGGSACAGCWHLGLLMHSVVLS